MTHHRSSIAAALARMERGCGGMRLGWPGDLVWVIARAVGIGISLCVVLSACDWFRYDPGNSLGGRTVKYAMRQNAAASARRTGNGGPTPGMDPTTSSSADLTNPAPYVPCDGFADCRDKARGLEARISWQRPDLAVAFRMEIYQLRQVAGDAIGYNDRDAQMRDYRARARETLQDWNGAIDDLGVVIAQEPNNVDALVRRSHLFFIQDDMVRALTDADEALKLKPDRVDALVGRSMIQARNQNLNPALADADRALVLDSRNLNALSWRATLHMQRKEKEPALADIGHAIALAPQNAGLYALKGNVHQAFDELDLARAAYRKACELGDPLWCAIAKE
jgi:Flp pilus assembly protein TadD